MYILGINAVFHDSSACLLKDGRLMAAAEEERFTHFKHGKRPVPFSTYELPFHAIDFCLQQAGLSLKDMDHIAYSFDPSLLADTEYAPFNNQNGDGSRLNTLFLDALQKAPSQLTDGWPHHLQKSFLGSTASDWTWHFVDHHVAHAASAFYPSPFTHSAVLTLDGRGELSTTTYSIGKGNTLQRIAAVDFPASLGLLYEKVTTHLGFLHSSDEYKVMALASFGQPEFENDFREIIQLKGGGQYSISAENLEDRFGPVRLKHEAFSQHHFNIAYALQKVLEETVLELADWFHKETGEEHLCMAGGIALNCVLNGRIKSESAFKNVWVQPASGDSGTALGAALWVDKQQRENAGKDFEMTHTYWGPEFSDEEIETFLKRCKIPFRKLDNIAEETAALLAEDKIIGWFQGAMEYGPRALGSRSILASPISATMQARLNEVKDREDFRPVAPVVLEEDAAEWFENAEYSPFMLFVYNIRKDKAEKIPAVRHVDGTARIQTINEQQHPLYYRLLKAFKARTGVPVLVNTSFNTLGKPIVCTPRDAIACFWTSPFDALVMGSFLLEK